MMKQIPMRNSGFALVDSSDYEFLMQWEWRSQRGGRTFYAIRCSPGDWKNPDIHMHRMIDGTPSGLEIDHKDGDGLHNWRGNLRRATRQQNAANQQLKINNKSGYIGVIWHKRDKHYMAGVKKNKKQYFAGYHDTPEAAARARDAKAIELNGEFARLNFPKGLVTLCP